MQRGEGALYCHVVVICSPLNNTISDELATLARTALSMKRLRFAASDIRHCAKRLGMNIAQDARLDDDSRSSFLYNTDLFLLFNNKECRT